MPSSPNADKGAKAATSPINEKGAKAATSPNTERGAKAATSPNAEKGAKAATPPKAKQEAKVTSATSVASPLQPAAEQMVTAETVRPPTFRQGDRIIVKAKNDHAPMPGLVQFVGDISSKDKGVWIGVQLDDPAGTSDGSVVGRRLFRCPNKHGDFFRPGDLEFEPEASEGDDGQEDRAQADGLLTPIPFLSERPGTSKRHASEQSHETAPQGAATEAVSEMCVCAGRGLQTCVVNQLAQFTITAYDSERRHREHGGDAFTAVVRPISGQRQLRVKVHDHGNGTYTCEYRAEVTGRIQVDVKLQGKPLPGSPFAVDAVTLRPETAKCILRGDALASAVARQPMAFEIEFVDALGQISHAEELDVRLERVELAPVEDGSVEEDASNNGPRELTKEEVLERMASAGTLRVALKRANGLPAADMDGKSDPYVLIKSGGLQRKSGCKPKTLNPAWNEEYSFSGVLEDFVATGLAMHVFDMDNPDKPERDTPLGDLVVSLDGFKQTDAIDFHEPMPTKGKLQFAVQWSPVEAEEEAIGRNVTVGDERVVIGSNNLIVREGFEIDTKELTRIAPGTRLQLHEVREFDDGFRAQVLVLTVPNPQLLSDQIGLRGWITAAHNDGRRRLMRKHLKLDQDERRRQSELWRRRKAADKLARKHKEDEKAEKAPQPTKAATGLLMTNYNYEIQEDPRRMAFAYGGLNPGTLQAHGHLIKKHAVHYSVGAAGEYLLHVGLRQKSEILPGSPFKLRVKPGPAHPSTTCVPDEFLPLRSVVGQEGSMSLPLLDNMGNRCIEGGAQLTVVVSALKAAKRHSRKGRDDSCGLDARCEDQGNGSFRIIWGGEVSGIFKMAVQLDGFHVLGSPTQLTMASAEIDILQCELKAGLDAVAGVPERLEIHCRDAFGNDVEPSTGRTFGLILLAVPSNEKTSKAEKAKEKALAAAAGEGDGEKKASTKINKEERANLVQTMESIPFEGKWDDASYSLSYVPRQAGDFELHVWCDPDGDGTRLFLPGCPLLLHIAPGQCSANVSFLRESGGLTNLVAGDRLMLKMQLRDEYGNYAPLSKPEDVIAKLEGGPEEIDLTLKPDVVKAVDDGRDSKKKNHVSTSVALTGAYEINSPVELVTKGSHTATVLLHGSPVTGSPVEIHVKPSLPVAAKSRLYAAGRHVVNAPIEVILQLHDRFGNEVEQGGVRVDAKVFGSKASDAQIVDRGDGTYTVTFTVAVAGDYKITVKVENIEMPNLTLHVIQSEQGMVELDDVVEQYSERGGRMNSFSSFVDEDSYSERPFAEVAESASDAANDAMGDATTPARKKSVVKKKKKTARDEGKAAKSSRANSVQIAAAPATASTNRQRAAGEDSSSKKSKKPKSARRVSIQDVAVPFAHSSTEA